MHALGPGVRWAAGGISVAMLLGGCTYSAPGAGQASPTASQVGSGSPLACASIEVRGVEGVPGDWAIAESVLVRGPEGKSVNVTLAPDTPAGVALGGLPKPGSVQTWSEGLTVERATVTTDPASSLDPVTLQAAIGQLGGEPLSLTNSGQPGFTNELQGVLGGDGTVAWRGARQMAVTFAGDCSSPSSADVTAIATKKPIAQSL